MVIAFIMSHILGYARSCGALAEPARWISNRTAYQSLLTLLHSLLVMAPLGIPVPGSPDLFNAVQREGRWFLLSLSFCDPSCHTGCCLLHVIVRLASLRRADTVILGIAMTG